MELLKHTRINNHVIKLEKDKQLPFRLIYSLKPVKLKTLKIYIETNLANGLICSSKFPAKAHILCNPKLNRNFCLYMDY